MIVPAEPLGRERHVLEGNQTLLLSHPGAAWLVQSGLVAVFAVQIEQGEARGERRYLFDVGAGEILFGAAACAERVLLAVAAQVSILARYEAGQVVSTVQGRRSVEIWIQKLGLVLEPLKRTGGFDLLILAGQQTMLNSGQAAMCSGDSISWVQLRRGRVRLMGYMEGELESSAELFPLPPGTWLQAEERVEMESVNVAVASHQLLRGVGIFELVFFRALEDLERLAATQARSRYEQRQNLNTRVALETLHDLASVSAERRDERMFVGSGPPLLAASQAVGEAQRIIIRAPIGDLGTMTDPLQAIALASGVRTRNVLLAGKWWTEENGPILAYKASDRRPIALLPVRPSVVAQVFDGSQYVLVDPTGGSQIPVSASIAATLDPVAATFYRSFGDKRRAWDLVRFGLDFYRKDVLMIVIYAVAGALLGMVIPQATAILFSQAIPDANRGLVLQVALGMAAALLGATLFDLARSISALRIQSGTTITLQAAVWDWLLKLSPTFFRDFSVGELRAHAEGVSRILDQLKPATIVVIASGLSSSLYIVLMLYYSIPLGLLGLVIGMVILAATAVSSTFLGRLESSAQQMEGTISGLMVQLINAVPKLRVVGAEQRAFAYWGKLYSRKQRVVNQIQQIRDWLRVMNVTLPILATGLAFGFALDAVDVGTFLAFSLALGVFIKATSELSDTFASLVSIRTHWRRTKRILDVQPEAGSGKVHPGRLTGRLMLDHVTFRYRKHGPLTLEDISLHAEPGECIALVGPSGGGKSTILNLLIGFEIPASGGVYVDGHDLGSLDLVAVRRQFGVVRQDSNSMADSIFQNIVCGSRCTMSEAWEAVQAAGLADDIEQMPMGMHTVIAEGGTNISVGQRQRLLIARALAQKPRILLFDEATSALDNRTQQIVTESIARLKATRVVVAHRLSTIRQADRIYVIESGRIVQEGTFDELSRQPGLFLRLMKRQMA